MKKKKVVAPSLPGRYGRMDAADLDTETAKFDQEFIADTASALSRQERTRDRNARRKRGRPRIGNGAQRVLITIESSLLRRSDDYAKKHGLTRSALIGRGLQVLLRENTDAGPATH
jgi:hypothetical protein